jgi:hypothetical protein
LENPLQMNVVVLSSQPKNILICETRNHLILNK